MDKRINDFLKETGMHPACIDMDECTRAFVSEMRSGLAGEASSLMMIPTYFSVDGGIERGGRAIALDAGGTNFRVALTEMGEDSVKILSSEVFPMPGSRGAITKDEFLDEVCGKIEPLLNDADKIGFCFSFPAEITPERDGKLVAFNKEVSVEGSEGMLVCAEIEKRLEKRGSKKTSAFVLLNDTIAAMLGGMASMQGGGDTIGFILGTGTNTCYSEKGENIKKLGHPEGSMIINMEAGGFAKLHRGKIDEELDSTTANPGDHIYEKMVAGGYLGKLVLLTLKAAARDGVIKDTKELQAKEDLELKEVSAFLEEGAGHGELGQFFTDDTDADAVRDICLALIERAAKLAVCNLAAIMQQTGAGIDTPVTIAAEGSTFLKTYSFRDDFDRYAREFITDKLGHKFRIFTSDNMTLAGCTVAASMTSRQ